MTGEEGGPGVQFPVVDGRRSTAATGRGVIADAAAAVDPTLAAEVSAAADWRRSYPRHLRRLVEAGLPRPEDTVLVARAGLASLHDRFRYERAGGPVPLAETLDAAPEAAPLRTEVLRGEGARPVGLVLPYRGERLSGDRLHRQLDRWLAAGVLEPTAAEALRDLVTHPDLLDLSDLTVAVLGAGAEMGPLHALSRWGATVAPVDLPGRHRWDRIADSVRRGTGRALLPVAAGQGGPGADLLTELPAVRDWLAPLPGPLVVGSYAYADGADHVRVAMAVDAVSADLLARRSDVGLAVLATPTDVYAVPEPTVAEARRRHAAARVGPVVRRATRGRLFAPNYPGEVAGFGIADCLVLQQGPNYALAKRLQQWRVVAAAADGVRVSANVAPPTRTRSVLRNRVLAAAYAGARRFGVEVFDPSTSNTLMAALLVHDLRAPARPGGGHPAELFATGAVSGGLWRQPYAPRSVLGLAVGLGLVSRRG